jgi:PAS domain S-box-containing protein
MTAQRAAGDGDRPVLAAELIVANAPDPLFVCDLNGKIVEVNHAGSQLLGLRRDEVLEHSLARFLDAVETAEFVAAVREVVQRGVMRNVRLGPRNRSGEVIPTALNASALRDAAGNVIGVIGILRDMRELDKARAYAESLIKNAPDPVFVSDLEGKVLQANDAVYNLLGFRPDELIEQSLSRIISAEERREFMAALREVVERGATRNARLHPRTASGEVIPTTLNASALRGMGSHVIGVIGILRDMRELDKAWRYAESLIKDAPDPVFVSDLQGKILQANAAVSDLLGLREEQVVEQSLSSFIGPEETREFVAALREVVERGITRNIRLNPRNASGEVIPTTLNASALRDAGGLVIGAIGILRDMRAYEKVVRELEASQRELEAADRAKDQFLAMVSHELRTPLTAILGWAKMLRGGMLDGASATRALEVIERNSQLQAHLIDDLLDLSRILTGKLRLELRPVDPVGVVEASIESVQASADAKGIGLKVTLDPSAGSILADPERLQQVVCNLLSNAIKFTPPDGRIELHLERHGATVRLSVRDSGVGIAPDLLPRIFDRFHQGENARRVGGLGLGLAIARHIVELHRGGIRAESAGESHGATFIVELPLIEESFTSAKTGWYSTADHPFGVTSLDGVDVLVLDDDADTRELLTAILHQVGAKAAAVSSANEALDVLQRSPADVLISDIGLPEEDGCAFIRKVRDLALGDQRTIQAIALTADARAETRRSALSAGFQLFLAKPIDPARLTAAVAQLVSDRSA